VLELRRYISIEKFIIWCSHEFHDGDNLDCIKSLVFACVTSFREKFSCLWKSSCQFLISVESLVLQHHFFYMFFAFLLLLFIYLDCNISSDLPHVAYRGQRTENSPNRTFYSHIIRTWSKNYSI